jgi:exosortase
MTIARAAFAPGLAPIAEFGAGSRRFAVLLALLFVALGESFADIARLAVSSSSHHHALLALPIAAWLAMRDRAARSIPAQSDILGLAVLALALTIWIVGRAGSVALVEHAGAVMALAAAAVAAYGRARAAAWAPALAMLAFATPFGDELTPALQELSADVVEALLLAASVPATRDGLVFATPVGAFEIAESCAGLRFLAASMMVSMLAAALFLQTAWKRLAFLAAAAMLALAANWLRAAAIIAGAVASNRRFGVGDDHLYFGWVIYVALLAALIFLAYRLRESPRQRPQYATRPDAPRVVLMFAALTFAMLGYQGFLDRRAATASAGFDLSPPQAAGWRMTTATGAWRAEAGGADKRALWGYWSSEGMVLIDAARYERDAKGSEIAGWGVRAADGQRWRRVGATELPWRQAPGRVARADIIANDAGDRIYVVTAYWTADEARYSKLDVKLRTTMMRLAGKPTDGGALFIASQSLPALAAFVDDIEPVSVWASQRRDRPQR